MTEIDIDLDKDFTESLIEEIIPEQIEAIECASHADDRLVCFMGSDGTIQVHRRHSRDRLALCPAEAREFYCWLANSAGIWKV